MAYSVWHAPLLSKTVVGGKIPILNNPRNKIYLVRQSRFLRLFFKIKFFHTAHKTDLAIWGHSV